MHMDTCASLYVYSCIFEYLEQLIWFTLWNDVYICMDCRNQLIKFIKQDTFLIELLKEILHSWAHLHAMGERQINDDSWSLHSSIQPQTSVVLWLQLIFLDTLLQLSLKHKALSNSFLRVYMRVGFEGKASHRWFPWEEYHEPTGGFFLRVLVNDKTTEEAHNGMTYLEIFFACIVKTSRRLLLPALFDNGVYMS